MKASDRFTPEQERRLLAAVLEGRPLECPRCRGSLDEWPIPPRGDVSYVRDRLWLVCPACGGSAVLDRRGAR